MNASTFALHINIEMHKETGIWYLSVDFQLEINTEEWTKK